MIADELVALIAVYRVHWGISSRTPWGSVTQPSYTIPPPTTIVGAFAQAAYQLGVIEGGELVVENGVVTSGAAKFVNEFDIKWATGTWISPTVKTGIPIAYFAAPYRATYDTVEAILIKRQPTRNLFNLHEIGYIVAPHASIAVALITKITSLSTLLRLPMHVSRLGSKESFIDPVYVAAFQLEVDHEGTDKPIPVPWLTPDICAEGELYGNYIVEKTPIPITRNEWLCWYSVSPCPTGSRLSILREVYHPRYPGWARLKPNIHRCIVARLGERLREFSFSKTVTSTLPLELYKILIPRRVVEDEPG